MEHTPTNFLIFLLLLTFPTNNVIFANAERTVTEELIKEICQKAKWEAPENRCEDILGNLKGKSLFPNPLAVLGTNYINSAKVFANKSADGFTKTYNRQLEIVKASHKVRLRYHECSRTYEDIVWDLGQVRDSVSSGEVNFVEVAMRSIINAAQRCKSGLNKYDIPAKENDEMMGMCNVILAICNKVKTLKSTSH